MEGNYPNLEQWTFRPSFTESSWFPDAFAHETETLIRALQTTLSTDADYTDVQAAVAASGCPSPVVSTAASTFSSNMETAPRRTRTQALSPPAAKMLKRKNRASKRSTTTFVVTDPVNFPQMVQQVTGIPVGGAHVATEAVLWAEPRRAGRRVAMEGSCLPTLDTSAFLLEQGVGAAAASSAAPSPGSQASFRLGPVGTTFSIDPPFPCFPTLESWGFM